MPEPTPSPPSNSNPLQEAQHAYKRAFGLALLFSFFLNLLVLFPSLFTLQVFDRVMTSRSIDTLVMLALITAVALVVLGILEAVRGLVLAHYGGWMEQKLGGLFLDSALRAGLSSQSTSGAQSLRDLSTLRSALGGSAVTPVMDAPWVPLFLAIVFLLHPLLGWIATAGAALLFGLAFANDYFTRKKLAKAGGASIMATQTADAMVRHANVAEAMGMAPHLVKKWSVLQQKASLETHQASQISTIISAMSKAIRLGLQVAMMGVGAWLVLQGDMMPGAMIASSIIMGRALSPVEQSIGAWKQLVAARDAYLRLRRQIQLFPPRASAMPLPRPKGQVMIDSLSYVFSNAESPTLRGLNLTIQPGETVAVVGSVASGKSTLGRLLVGTLVPQMGHVRLDGMDIAHWNYEDRNRFVGYLPAHVELFHGTVRENIARMNEAAAPEAIVTAAKLAGVHDMILRLPRGYDTPIGGAGGPGSTVLSDGQKQRLGLARAVFGEPPLIVLDEPNAALDLAGEAALQRTVSSLSKRRITQILIVHRPMILAIVDKILLLEDGQVKAYGPREEVMPILMQENGLLGTKKTRDDMATQDKGQAPPKRPKPSRPHHAKPVAVQAGRVSSSETKPPETPKKEPSDPALASSTSHAGGPQ